MLDVVVRGDAAHEFLRVLRRQRRTFDAMENAVDTDDGGVPTRTCKSEAPSDTTNCRRSDIA
jgi:hypothetical protein